MVSRRSEECDLFGCFSANERPETGLSDQSEAAEIGMSHCDNLRIRGGDNPELGRPELSGCGQLELSMLTKCPIRDQGSDTHYRVSDRCSGQARGCLHCIRGEMGYAGAEGGQQHRHADQAIRGSMDNIVQCSVNCLTR